ncbi:MAG: hypothetical protein K0B16_06085 [Burkholderiaceae bacterium]|jgi:hypothetical protein|nr:hypothetical protein [Burkholderiaceae bacterium]
MLHPLIRLFASRPQLLVEHLSAYAELFAEEFASASALMKQRWTLQLVGGACLAVAATLAGVAVMLLVALPTVALPWALALVPAVPGALGLWIILRAGAARADAQFAGLRRQLAADAALMRSAGES